MTEHNPGGKSLFPLMPGVTGEAVFSECKRYRHVLFREQSPIAAQGQRTALFCGMNPSTARADMDDPTCRREQGFAWREGCRFYVKVNVMDYRATNPGDLRGEGVQPRSDTNLEWIRRIAEKAKDDGGFAMAAWGNLHPSQKQFAEEALAVLLDVGVPLFCLGYNANGSPVHPLYVPADRRFRLFPQPKVH